VPGVEKNVPAILSVTYGAELGIPDLVEITDKERR